MREREGDREREQERERTHVSQSGTVRGDKGRRKRREE
jgi:hypothetical protein